MEHFLLYWKCYLIMFLAFTYLIFGVSKKTLIFCSALMIVQIIYNDKKAKIEHKTKVILFCTEIIEIKNNDTQKLKRCIELT